MLPDNLQHALGLVEFPIRRMHLRHAVGQEREYVALVEFEGLTFTIRSIMEET